MLHRSTIKAVPADHCDFDFWRFWVEGLTFITASFLNGRNVIVPTDSACSTRSIRKLGLRSPNGWENAGVVPVLRCARSHFEHSILSDHLQLQYALPSRESQLTLFRSAESKYTEG